MRSSEDRATRHAADPYQVLLDRHLDQSVYISDQKAANSINAALGADVFKGGKNYRIGDHEGTLHAVLIQEGTPGQAVLLAEMKKSLNLTRESVKTDLTGRHTPVHDRNTDSATLLGSQMLRHRPEVVEPDKTSYQRLETLSAKNLSTLDGKIADMKGKEGMQAYQPLIDTFMEDVRKRYLGAIATHATNNPIEGHISPTADRIAIDKFASAVSGERGVSQKISHTSATNTQHLQTHDLVFFNVYPQTNAQMKEDQMKSTRYLREQPEVAGSPYAAGGQSFSFPMSSLVRDNGQLQVMTLRDPVYPSGGTTGADAKRRLEQGGVFTVGGADQPPGTAARTIGNLVDRYETQENLFAGRDIYPALTRNVELGLYQTFHGLHEACKGHAEDTREQQFFTRIKDANEAVGPAKDQRVMDVIKMYQYPQLMVSGSVPVLGADVYRPTAKMIADSQRGAVGMVASSSAPSVATVHDAKGRQAVKDAFDARAGKEGIAKTVGNVLVLMDYVDDLAGKHGGVAQVKGVPQATFDNNKLFKVSFNDGSVETIKPTDMSRIRHEMTALHAAPTLASGGQGSGQGQLAASSSSTGAPSGEQQGADEHKGHVQRK